MGGATWRKPGRTCPDRSWCRTTSSDTMESGDTDRQLSRAELWQEHLEERGEGKRFERVNGRTRRAGTTRPPGWESHRWRARLHSASLRCARRTPHSKTPDANRTPLLTTLIGAVRPGASQGAPVRIGAGVGRPRPTRWKAATPIDHSHALNSGRNASEEEKGNALRE